MIPTLVINLLLYTGEFQQNLLLMLTGPKILIGRRLFVKRTGLKLKLIFTISTTEWMFATSSIHSLAKLSFYKIDWAPYSQTRSNWDPSNSNYGGKPRDCSQTRPKSITEPLTSMKMSYFLQALMKKSFPRAIFWIWWMMSVWDFLQHLINVTIESILEVWQMGALNGNFIFCKYSWIWISPKCCIVPRFHSSVQSCRS